MGLFLARAVVGLAWWLGASALHLVGCWLMLAVMGMDTGWDSMLTASIGGGVASVGLITWGAYMVASKEDA